MWLPHLHKTKHQSFWHTGESFGDKAVWASFEGYLYDNSNYLIWSKLICSSQMNGKECNTGDICLMQPNWAIYLLYLFVVEWCILGHWCCDKSRSRPNEFDCSKQEGCFRETIRKGLRSLEELCFWASKEKKNYFREIGKSGTFLWALSITLFVPSPIFLHMQPFGHHLMIADNHGTHCNTIIKRTYRQFK